MINSKGSSILVSLGVIALLVMESLRLNSKMITDSHDIPGATSAIGGGIAGAGLKGATGEKFSGDKVRTYNPDLVVKGLFSKPGKDPFKNFFSEKAIKVPTCLQWAVVTSIYEPNESIIGTANLKDWCIVIVGDLITPDEAFAELQVQDNVLYMSAALQKEMLEDPENTFMQQIPWRSFGRKNIGFVVAISHGAKVIYDFDDDNIITPFEDGTTIKPPFNYKEDVGFEGSVLLKYIADEYIDTVVQKTAFNPYPLMGAQHHHAWPRGFPLEMLAENFETWQFITDNLNKIAVPGSIKYSSIGVIQSLCNKDPDNDAVFRLSRYHPTQFEFDNPPSALPLLIPSSAYAPFNAQATTHLYSAFWGLYLPFSVTGRVSDIWRSFFTQRLFRYLGLNLVYTPPLVLHERSAHDYLADFSAEQDVYLRTSKLHQFLNAWSPNAAETLPEMIFELWVGLYEHDYVGLADVEGIKEWLHTLHAIGYQFPAIQKSQEPSVPQSQPSVEQQPYRSFPYFNTNTDGQTFAQFQTANENKGYEKWLSTVDWKSRPDSAVVKMIMMTMNEWPLLRSWVLYHGHLFGFENLYIIDASTEPKCTAFLRYARDTLGANVMFGDINLNQLEGVMTQISRNIAGSSDVVIKMDTDEFLMVFDNSTKTLTTSIADYLAGYAKHEDHPLRLTEHSRVGYLQKSIPSEKVCSEDIHAVADKFPLGTLTFIGDTRKMFFKGVWMSSKIHKMKFNEIGGREPRQGMNLGGHAFNVREGIWTDFGVAHYHDRCLEVEVENCKRVLERHNFISPTDTNDEAKSKLAGLLNCTADEICGIGECKPKGFDSFHKAVLYVNTLHCPDAFKKFYYRGNGAGIQNSDLIEANRVAMERFGPQSIKHNDKP